MAGRVQLTGIIEDRYVVLDRLGIGAFGEVYRAEDERLGRQVALKRLRLEILSETDELDLARQRFIQEARVAASLRHSNIVTVHDIVSADEMLLMVLELIEGPTLSRLLKERGRFSLEESVRLLAPAAEALDHAHREGCLLYTSPSPRDHG